MWNVGIQPVKTLKDFNENLAQIQGELSDEQARLVLAQFFKTNIGIMLRVFGGVELLPVQEIVLKAVLIRDVSLVVAGRGFSKSFLLSILAIIYPIFFPNSKMCLISSNFRNARRILEYAEKIVNNKKFRLLKQCFPNDMRRGNDIFQWKLDNGSEVFALPLSSGGGGEGLRGTRAGLVAIDEGLLISKEIQESIIRPFLSVKQNPIEEMKVKQEEDFLIKNGLLPESERTIFPKNKFCVFSSASYQFEYLYEMYSTYIKIINGELEQKVEKGETPASYFVFRGSYETYSSAQSLMDMTQINAARDSLGYDSDIFKREYRALFSDSSQSYFNIRRMNECTFKLGQLPTTQIIGDKDSKYILTIDPSYSANKNSDFFAMGVFLVNESERKITLVHNYGRAGGDIKEHYQYLIYILTHFNIVFMCIDGSGTEFINGFNESSLAKERNINVGYLTEKLDAEDLNEYGQAISSAKTSYNLTNRKICWPQNFNGMGRRMNENMQNMIDSGRLWFASRVGANQTATNRYMTVKFSNLTIDNSGLTVTQFKDKADNNMTLIDFIESQDDWIDETKAQIVLIEVKASASGGLTYDLPQNLRQTSGENKYRKDNYTTTLLGCWVSKIYFDLFFAPTDQAQNFFTPFVIR